jgi:hypothetical protein
VSDALCSTASIEAGESLWGSAPECVDTWLLLEHTEPWAPKALESQGLAEPLRERLKLWLAEVPRSRFQLLRRPGRPGKRTTFVVATAGADGPRLRRIELEDPMQLCTLKLEDVPEASGSPSMCLVCVHGRRDRCCALHGAAFYRAMAQEGVEVWQTSHLGGHRFAACALWLPDGLMYGRLRAEHAPSFVAAHRGNRIGEIGHFRGTCAYDGPTQAAEIMLRQRTGEDRIQGLRWKGTQREADRSWRVRFDTEASEHELHLGMETLGVARPASCGGLPEPVTRYVELS